MRQNFIQKSVYNQVLSKLQR